MEGDKNPSGLFLSPPLDVLMFVHANVHLPGVFSETVSSIHCAGRVHCTRTHAHILAFDCPEAHNRTRHTHTTRTHARTHALAGGYTTPGGYAYGTPGTVVTPGESDTPGGHDGVCAWFSVLFCPFPCFVQVLCARGNEIEKARASACAVLGSDRMRAWE